VPAVLAYNYFIRRLKLIGADLEDFATDLVNLAQRSQFRLPKISSATGATAIKDNGSVKNVATNGEVFA
jgi:biopolymer transport protein ExbB